MTRKLLLALLLLPAAAHAQHSKLSLESIGPAGGNGALAADTVGATDANKRVFFATAEPLTSSDTDSSLDLYSRTGGNTARLSTGATGGNGLRVALPNEPDHVVTPEPRAADERDSIAHLLAVARGKRKPNGLSSLENNIIVTEILDAARQSARTHQRVAIAASGRRLP